jgi:hypothetical protein
MKFLRNISASQIQDAFRESLKDSGVKTERWLAYFTDTRSGQDCVIGWTPGVGLETKVAGTEKAAINDKVLASAIFAIWLGDKPIQDDIKFSTPGVRNFSNKPALPIACSLVWPLLGMCNPFQC